MPIPDTEKLVSELIPFVIPMIPLIARGGEFVFKEIAKGSAGRVGELLPETAIALFDKFRRRTNEDDILNATIQQLAIDLENDRKILAFSTQLGIILEEEDQFRREVHTLLEQSKTSGLTIESTIKARNIYGEMTGIQIDSVPDGTKRVNSRIDIKDVKAGGKIVGVSLDNISSPPHKNITRLKIFISYSRKDSAIVDQLEKNWIAGGNTVLRDVSTIRSGEEWEAKLQEMITGADIFQLCWSEQAANSEFVRQEWEYALNLKRDDFIRPIYWVEPMVKTPDELNHLHFDFYEFNSEV